MGWVVLSLRKKELQRTHADLQMRELQIGRESRQLARQKMYEQSVIQADQNEETRNFRTDYNQKVKDLRGQISDLRNDEKTNDADNSADIAKLQQELSDAQLDFQQDTNETKSFFETELALLEEEVNDIETQYEQEKVEVEAQMQAVAQELQVVSDAISNAIQQSVIKL